MSPQLQIPVSTLPGCLPISGHGEELEQEGTIEEDLEPSSRSSRRSQVAHVKTRIPQSTLQYPGSLTKPPNLTPVFSPLSSCMCALLRCSSPARSLFPHPPGYPFAASLPAPKSVPHPPPTHTQLSCLPPEGTHISPSVLGTWPLPSVWNLQEWDSRSLPSGCLPLQGHKEAKLTSNDKEEQQHDRVEESQDEAEDVLVDHCRDQEHAQHGCPSGPATKELAGAGGRRVE